MVVQMKIRVGEIKLPSRPAKLLELQTDSPEEFGESRYYALISFEGEDVRWKLPIPKMSFSQLKNILNTTKENDLVEVGKEEMFTCTMCHQIFPEKEMGFIDTGTAWCRECMKKGK